MRSSPGPEPTLVSADVDALTPLAPASSGSVG